MAGPDVPGAHLALALAVAANRRARSEWRASALHRWAIAGPAPDGFALQPRDFRPADAEAGRRILAGVYQLGGASLSVGGGGDPWDRPSPTRAFAETLHRFDWLPDLIAVGPDGAAEALRLVLLWRRLFASGNAFAWSAPILARRIYNLACAGPTLTARASDAETATIASDLARQARDLLTAGGQDTAGQAAAAAVAAVALKGAAARRLLNRALTRLSAAAPGAIAVDGGHATRQASRALELLFDLETLDEAMTQRGLAAPDAVQRAIDRLAAAVRFSTLADGALATGQGGRPARASYVAAVRAQDETGDRPTQTSLGGYQRMDSRSLQVMVDVAPPPTGAWSTQACSSPLAIQVLAGGRRLIDPTAGRGVDCASSVSMGEADPYRTLGGLSGRILGPRLVGGPVSVEVQRHEAPGAVWLDLSHRGWNARHGIMHQRRLYLDLDAGDLRGEDRLTPTARAQGPDGRHFVPFALRFVLHAGVRAMVSQDRRSVLLRIAGGAQGWVLRNDILDISLTPDTAGGAGAQMLVMHGQRRADSGARVRWRLAPARSRVDAPSASA